MKFSIKDTADEIIRKDYIENEIYLEKDDNKGNETFYAEKIIAIALNALREFNGVEIYSVESYITEDDKDNPTLLFYYEINGYSINRVIVEPTVIQILTVRRNGAHIHQHLVDEITKYLSK